MKRITFSLVWICVIISAGPGLGAENARAGQIDKSSSATLDLFFIGKRHSNLEPCGCRSNQTSGLQYEATIYDKLAPTSSSLRLDTGEWTNLLIEQSPLDAMKTRYLLRGMKMMGLDAVGVGASDTHLSPDYLKSMTEKYPQGLPNLVSANVMRRDAPGKPAFTPYLILKKRLADGKPVTIGITAATTPTLSTRRVEPGELPILTAGAAAGTAVMVRPDTRVTSISQPANYLIVPALDALQPVLAELRPKVDLLLVLYSGDFESARALTQGLAGVDCLVVDSHPVENGRYSIREGRTTILAVQNIFGREVARARMERTGSEGWELTKEPEYLSVGPAFAETKPLADLIGEFKKETQTLTVPLPPYNVEQIYAGAAVCARCHPQVAESWKQSRHSQALQTLVDKAQQFNLECLRCHVTGYRQANGFYAVSHAPSMKMAGVQCEVCHGPAKEHADLQTKLADNVKNWMEPAQYQVLVDHARKIKPQVKVPESTCLNCHTTENDGHFVYAVKVLTIRH